MKDNLFEQIEKFVNNPKNKEEEEEGSKLLSPEELDSLIDSYVQNHEDFTEDDVYMAIRWAEDARIRHILLDLVLRGELKMTYTGDPDNFTFSALDK